jgi:hypothetical protein
MNCAYWNFLGMQNCCENMQIVNFKCIVKLTIHGLEFCKVEGVKSSHILHIPQELATCNLNHLTKLSNFIFQHYQNLNNLPQLTRFTYHFLVQF